MSTPAATITSAAATAATSTATPAATTTAIGERIARHQGRRNQRNEPRLFSQLRKHGENSSRTLLERIPRATCHLVRLLSDLQRSPFVANAAALGRRSLPREEVDNLASGEETQTSERQNRNCDAKPTDRRPNANYRGRIAISLTDPCQSPLKK